MDTPHSHYAKLHMATTLPDSSIQPVSGSRVWMTALKVVSMDILPNGTPCFTDVVILRQIASSYLKLRNQRSIMMLSAHLLFPSML